MADLLPRGGRRMRTAIIVGGLAVAGCLGVLGAVEAQKYSFTGIWPALTGAKTATTAAAPAEPLRPQGPRKVVTEIATPSSGSQAAGTRVAAGAPQQPAPTAQA